LLEEAAKHQKKKQKKTRNYKWREFVTWLLHLLMCSEYPYDCLFRNYKPHPLKKPFICSCTDCFIFYTSSSTSTQHFVSLIYSHTAKKILSKKKMGKRVRGKKRQRYRSHFTIDFTYLPVFLLNIFAIFN